MFFSKGALIHPSFFRKIISHILFPFDIQSKNRQFYNGNNYPVAFSHTIYSF